MRKPTWRIVIRPNRNGISVESSCPAGDVFAERLSKAIENRVIEFATRKDSAR